HRFVYDRLPQPSDRPYTMRVGPMQLATSVAVPPMVGMVLPRKGVTTSLFGLAAAGAVAVLAGLVLAGWWWHIELLKAPLSGAAEMTAGTAAGLLAIAVALLLLGVDWQPARIAGSTLAALVVFTVLGSTIGNRQTLDATDGSFALIGVAIALQVAGGSRMIRTSGFLSAASGCIALFFLLGYAYGVGHYYDKASAQVMAVHTATAFLLLSAAVLSLHPERGWFALLFSDSPVGRLIRTLIPAALLVPALFGGLRLFGQRAGLYSVEEGVALFVTANVVTCFALVMWSGQALERAHLAQLERNRILAESEARLETSVAERTAELEAFSYSVSHDLRAPLRAIEGFSQALSEDAGPSLGVQAQDSLARIRAASRRMSDLIDGLLVLSRVSRTDLRLESIDLSAMAAEMAGRMNGGGQVIIEIQPDLVTRGDMRLIRSLLQNLFENAIKFSSRQTRPHVVLGRDENGRFFVRDNGVGFNGAYASKLFTPFQRLHKAEEFPGTGIGLATVRRIVSRHGGSVSAESSPGSGATFYFTLGDHGE
ncbi:MAG TPA: ATP-binding protein, partial [Thermoanaerobaculia bacterium]|nr:ATP-binding protein [Thermoanaerobaculia bacterium]